MELDALPMRDVQTILSELHDRIHHEYQRALEAHERLARYLLDAEEIDAPGEISPETVSSCLQAIAGYTRRGRSNRDLVFDAIAVESRSIDEISEIASLTKKQVEGVVYAPGTVDRIQRDNSHAPPRFRLRTSRKAK